MKLSTLLETVDYFKFNNIKPINEAYKGNIFKRYYQQFLELGVIDNTTPFTDADGVKWENPLYFISQAHECCDGFDRIVRETYLFELKNIINQYNNIDTACEKIKELYADTKAIYEICVRAEISYHHNSTYPSIKAITAFEHNESKYIFNVHNIQHMLRLSGECPAVKLTDITSEDITEINFTQARQRKYADHLMFWEDENGYLCAISVGPKLICIINDNNIKQSDVINIYDFDKPNINLDEYVNPQKLSNIFNIYKKYGINSYAIDYNLLEKIIEINHIVKSSSNYKSYKRNVIISGADNIKKLINTRSTKIFTDPNYSSLNHNLRTPVKCYAISPSVLNKDSHFTEIQARNQFKKEYIDKYKTPNERLQDLKAMQARYLELRNIVDKSHEFKNELVKAENLFDNICDKISDINKFCLMVIQNPELPESKHLNSAGLLFDNPWYEPGHPNFGGFSESWLTYVSNLTSKHLSAVQESIMSFMRVIVEIESTDFLKIARSNPNYINSLQTKINDARDEIETKIQNTHYLLNKHPFQKFVTSLAEIKPEYAELFNFENLEF